MQIQQQIYMGSVCCLACFKLDQDEALERGVMLSLDNKNARQDCRDIECKQGVKND